MVRSSVPPQIEQLPGLPTSLAAPFIAPEPDVRRALAAVLRPERQGINPDDYTDITPQMIELAEPDALRTSIFDAPSSGATLYFRGGDNRPHKVAGSNEEYSLLAGLPTTLGETVAARVRQAHLGQTGRLSASGRAAGARGGVHAVENKAAKVATFLDKTLQPEIALLDDLAWGAAHPGFARSNSKEVELQKQVQNFTVLVLGRMLHAIGNQRGWSHEQELLASRTIDRRLFIDRSNNQHIAYFGELVALAKARDEAIKAVTQTRLHQAAQYITRHSMSDAE